MFVDLHIHTTASDGLFTPSLLLEEVKAAGLSCISVTDHDSVENVEESRRLLRDEEISLIPGVELSTNWEGKDIHILGYFIDPGHPVLLQALEELREKRVERMERIVSRMKEEGFDVELEEVLKATHNGAAGRSHLARILLKKGFVSSINEAFENYLAEGRPFYVRKMTLPPREAISLIVEAGGIPVLAHPGISEAYKALDTFIRWGLQGLEVYYPDHTEEQVKFLLSLSKERKLLISGGSDAHGLPEKGKHLGEFKVPYSKVADLLSFSEKVPL